MKYLFIISISLFLNMTLSGQIRNFEDIPKDVLEHLNEMGTDSCMFLNKYEGKYFNVIFKNSRKDFDFTGKKIGFITGSNGNTISNKKEYFDQEKDRFVRNYTTNSATLYFFDKNQKEESGGYDAVIVYWCKILLRLEDLPQKLK